jgi:glutathione S-transferase
MYVRTSAMSPAGRKVRLALAYLAMDHVEIKPASFVDPQDPLRVENPLGKMPVLTTDDGQHIYPSSLILAYLDGLSGGRLIPADPDAALAARQLEALCDGILEAGTAIGYERRMRPAEFQHEPWIEYQRGKIDRGLATLASMDIDPETVTVGTIALASLLSWLDARKPTPWREPFPGLVRWLDRFAAAVPAFAATEPTGH